MVSVRRKEAVSTLFPASASVQPAWPRAVPEKENPRGRPARRGSTGASAGTAKVGFVEHRTVLHLFRDFNRLWTFYVVAFQVKEPLEPYPQPSSPVPLGSVHTVLPSTPRRGQSYAPR